MSMFVVIISQPTRKGSVPLITRYINTDMTKYQLQDFLSLPYKGFIVTASELENWEQINKPIVQDVLQPVSTPEMPKTIKTKVIKNKTITLTEEEFALQKEYVESLKKTENKLYELKVAIQKRLSALSWVYDVERQYINLEEHTANKCCTISEIILEDTIFEEYDIELGVKNE